MSKISWEPNANIETIRLRAQLLQQLRTFMQSHDIMEVDTPILNRYSISDPYIQSMTTSIASEKDTPIYLHTSPEFCMKRLLAAGLGSIYQITPVFRDEELGKRHNAEFSMLEWYRVGFDYYQLMQEVEDLLRHLGLGKTIKMTYAEAFEQTLNVDPHSADTRHLQSLCRDTGWETDDDDRHDLLDYLFSEAVIKKLNSNEALIIYDYPECMSALATLKSTTPIVSERFELFINNMEIANGFNELTDADEQLARFESDLSLRKAKKLAEPTIDQYFIAALQSGLPKCAGVAIGVDRLLMVLSGKDDIKEVSTFTLGTN